MNTTTLVYHTFFIDYEGQHPSTSASRSGGGGGGKGDDWAKRNTAVASLGYLSCRKRREKFGG